MPFQIYVVYALDICVHITFFSSFECTITNNSRTSMYIHIYGYLWKACATETAWAYTRTRFSSISEAVYRFFFIWHNPLKCPCVLRRKRSREWRKKRRRNIRCAKNWEKYQIWWSTIILTWMKLTDLSN